MLSTTSVYCISHHEATIAHRHCFEAVQRSINDTIGLDAANRITWLLCGYLAQIPPVVQRCSIAQILRASFRKSTMWPQFTTMELHTKIRVKRCLAEGNAQEAELLGAWAECLLPSGKERSKRASRTAAPSLGSLREDVEEKQSGASLPTFRLEADLRAALPSTENQRVPRWKLFLELLGTLLRPPTERRA